jgi:GT2 family glycosyltransferase
VNLTAVIPYWNGHRTIERLLRSLPPDLPVIIVDDISDAPLQLNRPNTQVIRLERKGFFSGAVNVGINACQTDVLVLNQDVWFDTQEWQDVIADNRDEYALFGEGVIKHPAWPKGYVQGTFMFVRRDAWEQVGEMDAEMYPLWGSTCEWQLRACRTGFKALPLAEIPGMGHEERGRGQYGSAIAEALRRWPQYRWTFIKTPPEVSVVVPCFNYGMYLDDAMHSLLGGPTCLGDWGPQTLKSFEVIIVDDASTDEETRAKVKSWHRPEIGVRVVMLKKNLGTPGAINAGIERSFGRFIHILSADDMRESWMLEKAYRMARQHPHSIIYGDIMTFKDGQRFQVKKMLEYDFDTMLTRNPMPAGVMYHRQCWEDAGGYPKAMVHGREDWAFNVAAGIAGYCGQKVSGLSGNLCRRERQNRSIRTSTKEWRQRFLDQMHMLFPQLYRGDRPVGCCGGRRVVTKKKVTPATLKAARLSGREGMALVEYVGASTARKSYYGAETGTRYAFSSKPGQKVQYVDVRDYEALLGVREGKRTVFKPHKPTPHKVKPAESEPEIEVSIDATDAARRLATEYDIELRLVDGTGKDGRITVSDVRELLA